MVILDLEIMPSQDYPTFAELEYNVNKVAIFKKTLKANNMLVAQIAMNVNFLSHFILLMRFDQQLL